MCAEERLRSPPKGAGRHRRPRQNALVAARRRRCAREAAARRRRARRPAHFAGLPDTPLAMARACNRCTNIQIRGQQYRHDGRRRSVATWPVVFTDEELKRGREQRIDIVEVLSGRCVDYCAIPRGAAVPPPCRQAGCVVVNKGKEQLVLIRRMHGLSSRRPGADDGRRHFARLNVTSWSNYQ